MGEMKFNDYFRGNPFILENLKCPFCGFVAPDPWYNWSWRSKHEDLHDHENGDACGKLCCYYKNVNWKKEWSADDALDGMAKLPLPYSRKLRHEMLFNYWRTERIYGVEELSKFRVKMLVPLVQVFVLAAIVLPVLFYFNL